MRYFLLIMISSVLAGCATQYSSNSVTATRTSEYTVRITAKGNIYTDEGTTNNYVLLKAAEETKRYGFDMFKVINYSSRIIISDIAANGDQSEFSGISYEDYNFAASESAYIRNTVEFRKPRTDIIIKMMHGEMPKNPLLNLYLANDVINNLKPENGENI